MTLVNLSIWLVLIIILSMILDFILRQTFHGSKYRIMVAPGVIIHELSHAIACLITVARVKEINFFDNKGGYVKHEKSKIPIIGPVIISLAPLMVGIVLVYILSRYVVIGSDVELSLNLSQSNINKIIETVLHLNLLNIKSLITLYLLISIGITMAPSFKDFTNAFIGLISLVALLLAVNYFFVIKLPETNLIIAFSLVTMVLILGIISSMILLTVKSILFR